MPEGQRPAFRLQRRLARASRKVSRFGSFEIEKKAPDPPQETFLEEVTVSAGRSGDATGGKARHDLAKNCGVIFRFRALRRFLDTKILKGFA